MTANEARDLANKFDQRTRMPEIMETIEAASLKGETRQAYLFPNAERFLKSKEADELKRLGYRIMVSRGAYVDELQFFGNKKKVYKKWNIPSIWISWDNHDFGEDWEEA